MRKGGRNNMDIKEKIEKRKTLQFNILKRFMSEEEIKDLLSGYKANMKHGYYKNRGEILSSPIDPIEKKILRKYLFETDKAIREIAKEMEIKSEWGYISKAGRAAMKVLYQNRDKLNLEKLLE
jgi:hypothetical protein